MITVIEKTTIVSINLLKNYRLLQLQMPILYKTSVKESLLHGKGLFADEDIPEGVVWWTMEDLKGVSCTGAQNRQNIIYDQSAIEKFAREVESSELKQVLNLSMYYEQGEVLIFFRDGSGTTNHSHTPNSRIVYNASNNPKLLKSITLRKILAGQEIVENYGTYIKRKNNWVQKIYEKNLPSRLEFEIIQTINDLNPQ